MSGTFDYALVNFLEYFEIAFRGVLLLASGTSLQPQAPDFPGMRPGPLDLTGQVVGIARSEMQPRASIVDDLLHASQAGADPGHATREGLGNGHREPLVPLTGKDQKARLFYHFDDLSAGQASSIIQVQGTTLCDF